MNRAIAVGSKVRSKEAWKIQSVVRVVAGCRSS